MARDRDRKSPKKVMAPYTCPDCGKTQILVVSKRRQRCPDCAKAWNKKESSLRLSRMMKDNHKIRYNGIRREQEKKPELTEDEKAHRKQVKQCKGCHWWRSEDGGCNPCCHYYLRHGVGHRRDPGDGPGDCRSFAPKRAVTRKQLADEARRILEQIERDAYAQQPRWEDGADG